MVKNSNSTSETASKCPAGIPLGIPGMWIQPGWTQPGTGRRGAIAPRVAMAAWKQLGVTGGWMGFNGDSMELYGDLLEIWILWRFTGDLMGFYEDLMGFNGDFMEIYWRCHVFYIMEI